MPLACTNNWTSRENRDSHVTPNIHRKWIAWKTTKIFVPIEVTWHSLLRSIYIAFQTFSMNDGSTSKIAKCSIVLEINMELIPLEISELAVNWQPTDAREIQQEVENKAEQRIFRYLHIGVAHRARIRLVIQASLFPWHRAKSQRQSRDTRPNPPTKRESHLHSYRNISVDHRATAPSTPEE